MFLSFVVPVYNTEKYLPECLDSLLEQDIPKEEYEIICVNDGSTDNSLEILHAYQEKFPNIVVIDKENSGVAMARNAGMDAAKGDYIWFVDSDDFIQMNILHLLWTTVSETEYDRVNMGIYTFQEKLLPAERDEADKGLLQRNTYLYNIAVWDNLFRLPFLRENKLYFRYPEVRYSEDALFMFEFSLANSRDIAINKVGYYYRRSKQSLTTDSSLQAYEERVRSYYQAVKILAAYYESGVGKPQYIADLLMTNLWFLLYALEHLSFKKSHSMLKQLKINRLFPFMRPEACTVKKSYQTTRTDFVGKLFDYLYINMHRPWGFWAMFLLQRVINIKHRIAKAR